MRFAGFARDLIDFCYPRLCVVCEGEVLENAFCGRCATRIQALADAPACGRCAMPLAEVDSPCPYCFGEGLKPYDRIARLCVYVDPVKELIHRIKYHRLWNITEMLASYLLRQRGLAAIVAQSEVIVPVPLHPLRQISRGFNQAEVLARHLAKATGNLKVVFPAVRLKHTETQTHLTKSSRVENLRDAFGLVSEKAIKGKRVLVVDDVLTTGATLQSLARTLKPAGFESINAITIAIADPKNRGFQAV